MERTLCAEVFLKRMDEEMDFNGTEGYVGDEIKGMLKENSSAEVEMTFHFDHIFGDKNAPADDHINTGSAGFDYFMQFANGSNIKVAQKEMKSTAGYKKLMKSLWTLGHLGEGHCHVSNQTSAGID